MDVFFSLYKWFFQPRDVTFYGLLQFGASPSYPTGVLPQDLAGKLSSPDPLLVPPNQNPGSAPDHDAVI